MVNTQHVGYNRHDVIDGGEVIGRAYQEHGAWSFYGWNRGVEIKIEGRQSLTDVAMMASKLFKVVE